MKFIHSQFLKDKLTQYQNNELDKEEEEIIDQWFAHHLKAAALNEFPKNEEETAELQLELQNRLHAATAKKPKIYQLRSTWISVACALIVMLSLTFFYLHQPAKNVAADQIFHTANGKMEKIILPDSTEIWMNAGTTIRIASGFSNAATRKVYLDRGEAFFKVKRDTLRPFSIATGKMMTTVLGTSFNIRAYPETKIYQVAVSTGKVRVARQQHDQWQILNKGLVKGDVLSYSLSSAKTTLQHRDVSLISNWKANRSIYADGLTLSEIGEELARQYAIDVRVSKGGNEEQRYHLVLPHQDIKTVLQQLSAATGMNYKLTDSQLIINPANL